MGFNGSWLGLLSEPLIALTYVMGFDWALTDRPLCPSDISPASGGNPVLAGWDILGGYLMLTRY